MNDKDKLFKAIAEVAKTAGSTPGGRSAFAELMIEITEPQHLTLDIFNTFMPTRTADIGEQTIKRLRRGKYSVQTMVPGTSHLVSQPMDTQDFHQYVFDRLIGGVRESLWNVQEGKHITIDMMRARLQWDIMDNMVARVFGLLSSVWTSANTPSHYLQTSAITANALDTLIENVMYTAGNVKAIMGTRRAMRPIYELVGFREYVYSDLRATNPSLAYPTDKLMEYLNTNRVTSYKGITLIELPQTFKGMLPNPREALFPEDKLIMIGENAGEMLLYGGVTYQDYTDNTIQPADYVLHAYQSYGMVVDMPQNIGVIKIV